MKLRKLFLFTVLIVIFTACTNAESDTMNTLSDIQPVTIDDGKKLQVVASTNIIGDVVANVGGDSIELSVLIEAGQDPHSFIPTAQDLAALEDADLVFLNGLNLEEGLIPTIQNTTNGYVIPISEGIDILTAETKHEEEHEHHIDPHVWMDPLNIVVWVKNIDEALAQADPDNAAIYQANADAYTVELETLDAEIRERLSALPAEERILVTDHNTFGYFARAYEFAVIGTVVPGISTTTEPSAAELAALVDILKDHDVSAIFVGESAGERLQDLAEVVAAESGMDVSIVFLFTGSLAPVGETGDTYLEMMRYNIDAILIHLTG